MFYINTIKNGLSYGNLYTTGGENRIEFPEEFLSEYYKAGKRAFGFVDLQIEDGKIVSCVWNDSDYAQWDQSHPISQTFEQDNLNIEKKNKIKQSKNMLEDFLIQNPLQWIDGKYYSVTQEKQSLLTSNIATYQIEVQANPEAIITWNATGEECVQWDIQQLCALAVAIKDYVKPMVTYQQRLEIQINNCQNLEESNSIEINYDQFKQSN